MRRREPPRVVGPYQEKSRWRIVVVEQGQRKSFFCASQEEALKLKAQFAKEVDLPASRKLADVLVDWEQEKVRSGSCKLKSAQHQTMRLRRFFQPMLEQDLPAMTARRAAALYESHTGQRSRQTGRPLSAATQRFDLWTAQFFFGWAVKRGYAGRNRSRGNPGS